MGFWACMGRLGGDLGDVFNHGFIPKLVPFASPQQKSHNVGFVYMK